MRTFSRCCSISPTCCSTIATARSPASPINGLPIMPACRARRRARPRSTWHLLPPPRRKCAMSLRSRIVRRWMLFRLSPVAKRMRREGLTYLRPVKLVRIEEALRRLGQRRVPGDYLEFGVALGGTAALIAQAARRADARFVGLDVFATIPPPTSEHDDAKSRERYAVIAAGEASGIGGDVYYG